MVPAAAFVPRDKRDLVAAHRAVEAGWPAVQPVVGELTDWCLDGNWPVAQVLAPFLGSLGAAVADQVRAILQADDAPAKYFILTGVVEAMPASGVAALADELRRLVSRPTPAEAAEQLPELAEQQLARLEASCGDRPNEGGG